MPQRNVGSRHLLTYLVRGRGRPITMQPSSEGEFCHLSLPIISEHLGSATIQQMITLLPVNVLAATNYLDSFLVFPSIESTELNGKPKCQSHWRLEGLGAGRSRGHWGSSAFQPGFTYLSTGAEAGASPVITAPKRRQRCPEPCACPGQPGGWRQRREKVSSTRGRPPTQLRPVGPARHHAHRVNECTLEIKKMPLSLHWSRL